MTAFQHYVISDKLPDGRTVHIRAICPDDKPVLAEGMHHLSRESLYFRFFSQKERLTEDELAYFTELDFAHHVGLLATVVEGDSESPAGVGRYIMMSSSEGRTSTAELAFAVVEEYQGLGIATMLLKQLIEIAKAEGVAEFIAFVMPENIAMQRVFHKAEVPVKSPSKKAVCWRSL